MTQYEWRGCTVHGRAPDEMPCSECARPMTTPDATNPTPACGNDEWDTRYECVKPKGHPATGPGLTDHDYRRKMPRPAAALKAKIRALASLTPEDWAERRGADPIARTINAVFDIIDYETGLYSATEPGPLDVALAIEARMRGVSVNRVRADAGLEIVVSNEIELLRAVEQAAVKLMALTERVEGMAPPVSSLAATSESSDWFVRGSALRPLRVALDNYRAALSPAPTTEDAPR